MTCRQTLSWLVLACCLQTTWLARAQPSGEPTSAIARRQLGERQLAGKKRSAADWQRYRLPKLRSLLQANYVHELDPEFVAKKQKLDELNKRAKTVGDLNALHAPAQELLLDLSSLRRKSHQYFVSVAQGKRAVNLDTIYSLLYKTHPRKIGDRGNLSRRELEEFRSKLGDRFIKLLLEPGILYHRQDFIAFAQEELKQNPGLTPYEVRDRFKQKLGTVTVYRGYWLTAEQAATIQRIGMLPRGFNTATDLSEVLYTSTWHNFSQRIHKQLSVKEQHSPVSTSFLLSVAENREYVDVALDWVKNNFDVTGKQRYVFKVDMPRYYVFHESGMTAADAAKIVNGKQVFYLDKNGQRFQAGEAQNESYVEFGIQPNWIKSVEHLP